MTNIGKYRKLSIIAMIVMVLTWLLAMAGLWNSLLSSEARHEGWVIVFMIIVLIAGAYLFFIAFNAADIRRLEKIRKEAFEAGKSEIFQETEKKKKTETELKNEAEDLQIVVDKILAGIHGVRSENTLCNKLLTSLAKELEFVQGIMYVLNKQEGIYNPIGEYALTDRKPQPFKEGEGIPGQVAENKTRTVLYDIPENYFVVSSGLGNAPPKYLIVEPVLVDEKCIGVLEIAAFKKPDETTGSIMDKVLTEVGHKLNKYITA
jgi:putative methionine-R-sulfoxide reductase with GAF domain